MKLVLTLIDFKDWDIDYINKVIKTYGKLFRSIYLQIQYLLGNKIKEI